MAELEILMNKEKNFKMTKWAQAIETNTLYLKRKE